MVSGNIWRFGLLVGVAKRSIFFRGRGLLYVYHVAFGITVVTAVLDISTSCPPFEINPPVKLFAGEGSVNV